MKKLINKTVNRMFIGPGESVIKFLVGDDVYTYHTNADCCSETWFADIIGVDNLLGHKVTKVEELDLPAPDDRRTRQDHDQAYGIKLTTNKGMCEIIYRNSSNGYYGGSLEEVNMTDHIKNNDQEITKDWSA